MLKLKRKKIKINGWVNIKSSNNTNKPFKKKKRWMKIWARHVSRGLIINAQHYDHMSNLKYNYLKIFNLMSYLSDQIDGSSLGCTYIMVEVVTPTKPTLKKKKKIIWLTLVVRKALWVEYWMILTSLHVYWLRKIHYNTSVNNIYYSFESRLAKGIQELLIIYNLAPNTILEC